LYSHKASAAKKHGSPQQKHPTLPYGASEQYGLRLSLQNGGGSFCASLAATHDGLSSPARECRAGYSIARHTLKHLGTHLVEFCCDGCPEFYSSHNSYLSETCRVQRYENFSKSRMISPEKNIRLSQYAKERFARRAHYKCLYSRRSDYKSDQAGTSSPVSFTSAHTPIMPMTAASVNRNLFVTFILLCYT